MPMMSPGAAVSGCRAVALQFHRAAQHHQHGGFCAGERIGAGGEGDRTGNRGESDQLRRGRALQQRTGLEQQHGIDRLQLTLLSSFRCSDDGMLPCRTVCQAAAPRRSSIMRKMPCAISTFSDSSERNSSVGERQAMVVSTALTVFWAGLPSMIASNPTTSGAAISLASPPGRAAATRPSSRNWIDSTGLPAS